MNASLDFPGEAVLALPEEPTAPEAAPPPEPDGDVKLEAPCQRVSVRLQALLEGVLTELEKDKGNPALLKHADMLARAMTAVCVLAEKEHQVDDAAPRPIDDARRAALADRIERLCRQWRSPQAPEGAQGG